MFSSSSTEDKVRDKRYEDTSKLRFGLVMDELFDNYLQVVSNVDNVSDSAIATASANSLSMTYSAPALATASAALNNRPKPGYIKCLTNSEVYIDIRKEKEREMTTGEKTIFTESNSKTFNYVDRMKKGVPSDVQDQTASDLRNYLEKLRIEYVDDKGKRAIKSLHQFEIASFINLSPQDYEEATALIPSLRKFTEEEINDIINEISKYSGEN